MERSPASQPGPQERDRPTDAELDWHVLTRLKNLGIDLSVLPYDDEDAPMDQKRVLAMARRFLRGTIQALNDFELDPQEHPPVLYPAPGTAWTREEG